MKTRKRACFALLAAVLFATAFASAASGAEEEETLYGAPEELMEAFTGFVAGGDFASALDCFASSNAADRFNFTGNLKRLKSFGVIMPISSDHDGFAVLNRMHFNGQAANQLKGMIYSLLLPARYSEVTKAKMVKLDDDPAAEAAEIAEALNPERLAGLTFLGMELARPELQQSEQGQRIAGWQSAVYGFDETADYLVFYEWNGSRYVGGAIVTRYGDGWFIHSLNSNYGATSSLGALERER